MNLLNYEDITDVLDNVKLDGRRRNAICDCPYCGKTQKFGISLVKEGNPWNCFVCQESGRSFKLLSFLGRLDLATDFFQEEDEIENPLLQIDDEELDLELDEVELPPRTRRVSSNKYLENRGWYDESFFDFPVYKSRDFKYEDYIILGVEMYGELVGYVSRHIWDKSKIESHNRVARRNGEYQILRYKNSDGNEFGKMLYGFDTIKDNTDTVILVEGAMDVIQLSQELELFDSDDVRALATFGKKISDEQVFHLQEMGIKNVIVFYDTDAVDDVKKMNLHKFFNVLVASADDADGFRSGMDVGDLSSEQIEQCLGMARKPEEAFYDKVVILEI